MKKQTKFSTILFAAILMAGSSNLSAQVVTIGTQTWDTKNLDVSTFRDGTVIPECKDALTWIGLKTAAWCYYNNDSTTYAKYGKLYNWYAVNDPRGLAPLGYHIPTISEWQTLTDYLGGNSVAGLKMVKGGSSGFEGLPASERIEDGKFQLEWLNTGWWWSSTKDRTFAWYFSLSASDGTISSFMQEQQFGFSVRCLKD